MILYLRLQVASKSDQMNYSRTEPALYSQVCNYHLKANAWFHSNIILKT